MDSESQETGSGQHGGLFDSLRTLAATVLAIGRTRLELLSTELEEERMRLNVLLMWALIALFCASVGTVLVTLIVVVMLWDTNRILALGIPALLFLLGAVLSWRVLLAKEQVKPKLFSSSLAELSKDREQLTTRS